MLVSVNFNRQNEILIQNSMSMSTYNFQGDNQIIVEDDSVPNVLSCKFNDSYTITIYSCTPKGVSNNEFYVELNSHDETLISFLTEIFCSMNIPDGSLEKTIIGDNMITLIHNDRTEFRKEFANGSISQLPHVKLLGSQYHLIANKRVMLTIVAEKFKILSNKYLVMDFDLAKLTIQRDSVGFSFETDTLAPPMMHKKFAHISLDDFIAALTDTYDSDDDAVVGSKLCQVYDTEAAPTVKVIYF